VITKEGWGSSVEKEEGRQQRENKSQTHNTWEWKTDMFIGDEDLVFAE